MLAQSAASRWALAGTFKASDGSSGSSAFVGNASTPAGPRKRCREALFPAKPSPCRASAPSAKAMQSVSETELRPQTGASATAGSEFVREHLRKLKAYTPIEPFEVGYDNPSRSEFPAPSLAAASHSLVALCEKAKGSAP